MNKLVRSLLSGASLVTLQLCAVSAARAAGTTISGAHGAVTNPAGSTQDYIFVTGATITGDLTNEGTLGPNSDIGIDVTNSTISGAVINATTGVIKVTSTGDAGGILIASDASVAGGVQNAGKILISNMSDTNGFESAKAIAYFSDSVAKITNTGVMNVNVQVIGTDTDFAEAEAHGVSEYVNSGNSVNEAFTGNSGSIILNAVAAATSESAHAKAFAESAVWQDGSNGTTIAQLISNTGTVSLTATANAVGTDDSAEAEAFAGRVFYQEAETASSWINQGIANQGAVHLVATATAQGTFKADASAKASAVLYQFAEDAAQIAQSISNSGALTLSAKAKATTTFEIATARADARDVLYQEAVDVAGGISQSITNTGAISLAASAAAHGSSKVKAYASAEAVIYQEAVDAAAITQKITNSGALTVSLMANATASDGRVFAGARAGEIVAQFAEDSGSTTTQSITNSGAISLAATAMAKGSSAVKASAKVNGVFSQEAFSATGSIVQGITNSGSILANLTAVAAATAGDETKVKAEAAADEIFFQRAENAPSISQAITNSGSVTLAAKATATAASDWKVGASAEVEDVFIQQAFGGNSVTQSITNSGALTLSANAKATATGATKVNAGAWIGDIFYQDAAVEGAGTISQGITNTGDLKLTAAAKLVSAGTHSQVSADAGVGDLFSQYASGDSSFDTTSITQAITNSGDITVSLSARAERTAVTEIKNEQAKISADDLFNQFARNGVAVTQSITNSGAITITGKATAVGKNSSIDRTYATASVEDLFRQNAYAANSATLSITNSGPITVTMTAAATGPKAHAFVRARSVLVQTAHASDDISETADNSGDVSITLASLASGASVRASARLETAVKQRAFDASQITQSISNSGSLVFNLSAKAKGARSDVSAKAWGTGLKQHALGTGSIDETVTNSGTLGFNFNANAVDAATTDRAEATARLYSVFDQSAEHTGSATDSPGAITQSITNSGALSVAMSATAKASHTAEADATAEEIAYQSVVGGGTVSETVTNTGSISVLSTAKSTGLRDASANARDALFVQRVEDTADATLSSVNGGSIIEHAFASAAATQAANAQAEVKAGTQEVEGSVIDGEAHYVMSVTNSGTIDLLASAKMTAGLFGEARASAYGYDQELKQAPGTEEFTNSGTINVAAVATGLQGKVGAGVTATTTRLPFVQARAIGLSAKAFGFSGVNNHSGSITTFTDGAPLTVAIHNSGTLSVSATANAAALAAANVVATATGIAMGASSKTARSSVQGNSQGVFFEQDTRSYGAGVVNGAVDNSGSLLVSATANGGIATANGIRIAANTIGVDITNEEGGLISVAASGATAVAMGIVEGGQAFQSKFARRTVAQTTSRNGSQIEHRTNVSIHGAATTVTGNITNNGTISVSATGNGVNIGDGGGEIVSLGSPVPSGSDIKAHAEGISVNAETMSGNIVNAGTINVAAAGPDALANGIHVFASQSGSQFASTETFKYRGTATGHAWTTVTHSTPFHTAVLEGSKFTGQMSNSGTISVSATGANARATGILVEDAEFDSAFVNSGKIFVSASGTGASAVGVQIDASSLGSGASFQNNGGTISATLNGGWGSAIDVSGAPATLALGLNGGSIFGNVVENAAGNAISVGSGNLVLNGLINPSRAKLGSLTVGAGGTLSLANNAVLGDASAYVNSFKQTGTLAITGGTDGSSGSIHAVNASLTGAAIVNLDLGGGIYGTSTTYKVVFSDNALDGTWSSVKPASATTFFSASGVYTTNEADITLTRATFDSIAGLTDNEVAVAGAIETIYDGSGTSGPLGRLLDALFNLTPQQYADALEALSGMPAGELTAVDQATAQSFLDAINNHLAGTSGGDDGDVASLTSTSQMLAANIAPTAVTPAQMTSLSGTHVWGGGFQSGNSVNRTASGPAYDSHNNGLLAGVDVPVSPDLLFGVAGSWSTGDIQTEKMEGFGTFTALQVAGYARYVADNGLYAQGDVSYGDFTNKLNRYVAIPGFGAGNVHGTFDSKAWGLYGETGWKFNPSGWATSLTPYAAVSYLDAKSDGYTETGSFGAPLTVGGSSSKATSSYLGLKLSTDWQVSTATITPRITAAWQHDFTKNAWEMSAAFAAVPTAGFGLNGSDLSRDGAFLDGGVTLHIAEQVDVLLDYQGRFTSDRTDNAFMARANIRF